MVQIRGHALDDGDGGLPNYKCRFDARTVPAVLSFTRDGEGALSCVSPARNATNSPLEVSLNAQQFSTDKVRFRWVPPIDLSVSSSGGGSLAPPAMPPGFLHETGGAITTTTTARPPVPGGPRPAAEETAASVRVFGLSPLSGPQVGGTQLQLFAPGFEGGIAYRCRFNAPPLQSDEVAVYDDGTEILRCRSLEPGLTQMSQTDTGCQPWRTTTNHQKA